MILQHTSRVILTIKFTGDDWDNGTAREMIDYMKTMPKGSKFYNGTDKCWRINKDKAGTDALRGIYELQEKSREITEQREKEDFDAEAWKNEVFGEKEELI